MVGERKTFNDEMKMKSNACFDVRKTFGNKIKMKSNVNYDNKLRFYHKLVNFQVTREIFIPFHPFILFIQFYCERFKVDNSTPEYEKILLCV